MGLAAIGLAAIAAGRAGCGAYNATATGGGVMADKITIEKLPNGKWACYLHLPHVPDPINLGKEFKNEQMAETWQDVSECDTAVAMMTAKHKK
jgi:hypothetical protein